uniref:Cadherin domain-containing protein n=1 Tax=Seriola lalandi dorsalis TaxID=1841481 RepID=A0A3B4ZAP7_SERLL
MESHCRLQIDVVDVNDNTPDIVLTSEPQPVREDAPSGTVVALLNARDADSGNNSKVTLQLPKGSPFTLKPSFSNNYALVTNGPLDREKKQNVHHLLLTALDGGNPVKTGTSKIIVTVLDNNDNVPVFKKALYKISLPENRQSGFMLAKVEATDADEGINGEIEYSFAEHTPEKLLSIFQINSETGEIFLIGQLDYENVATHEIDITAKDRGIPEMEGHCRVQVEVIDVNDNAPEIVLTSKPSQVPEDAPSGTVVALLTARDLDSGDNGKVTVHLPKHSPLTLKPSFSNNYALVTRGNLDRESFSQYNVEITATDSGSPPLSSKKTINVIITDVNDNPPVFTQPSYNVYLKENGVPGSILYSVSASDLDFGENAKISYSILDSKIKNECCSLKIKEIEGGKTVPELVLEKPLDREKKAVHKILLTALDGGNPVRSGTSQITISVLDINDNFPVFEKNVYKVTLGEKSVKGAIVIKPKATDADEGLNGEIEFSFGSRTPNVVLSIFDINALTGEISLKGELDYETAKSYDIDVTAKDKGSPEMEGHCRVQVDITDFNDNAPEIVLTSQPKPVREDAPSGTVVALISARDLDSADNGRVTLKLAKGSPFDLKPSYSNNYALVTSGALDRESSSHYDIEITATDSGSPPLSSKKTIPVSITDVNDNPPVFIQPSYNVYLKENGVPGSILYSVSASDLDFGENAKISYSILDSKVPVSYTHLKRQ